MSKQLYAFAAAVLLSTTGLALAQGGTTIVPAGQSADAGTKGAAAQPAATGQTSQGNQASQGAGAAATGQAATSSSDASGQASAGSDQKKMSDVKTMQPDKSPSKDTATEGNFPTVGDLGEAKDPAGNPTYDISADGKFDWYTWRGYKKFMANCMQCHGPDGLGSSFAPNLTDQLTNLSYYDFAGIVVGGQKNKWNPSGNSVMPAWGNDPNVMCSLDAIYIYLRGRADGVVPRGEPKPHAANKEAQKQEYSCLGF
ncbi:c-type cytochrome [Jiella sp. M17.18]|uniref:c-type cytochrome n=1 Tax=Jiella sp. M17.18 TaxID=3234247 RepID=UPI0034DEA55E